MSWWNAKYKNNHGEYEITFASKYYEKAKAVEKVCHAVIDKMVKKSDDIEVVVRCRDCKYFNMLEMECQNDAISTDNEDGASYSLNFYLDDFCSYGERKEGAD